MSAPENEITRGYPSLPPPMQKLDLGPINNSSDPVVRIFSRLEAYARTLNKDQALLFWFGVKPLYSKRRAQIELNMDQLRLELQSETDFYLEPEKITEFYKTLPAESQRPYLRFCIDLCKNAERRIRREEVNRMKDIYFLGEQFPPHYARIRAAYESELEKLEVERASTMPNDSSNRSLSRSGEGSKSPTHDKGRIRLKCDVATFVHAMTRIFGDDFELFEKKDGGLMPWTPLASIIEDKYGKPPEPGTLSQTKLNNANTKLGKPRGARNLDPKLDALKAEIQNMKP